MDEMRAHLADAPTATTAGDSDYRQFVFQAGQIQLNQVQSVFNQLNHAADDIKSGIQNLRTEAGASAELAVKVGGTTLNADVASQCQSGIGEILGIVGQAIQKITDILAAFQPLQASFVDCTGKAATLAGDVRRAGLNAQIFAIHAPDGATLEVLAGRVHIVSEEVIEHVARLGTALNHTSEMLNNLRQRLEDFQILCRAEQVVLADESVLSQKKLADLEKAIPVHIQCVTQRQGTFAEAVEQVLAKIQFPEAVAQASPRSIGFFQDLVAWGSKGGSAIAVESAASRKIDLLKSKYTMESEMRAHAAALQPALDPPTSCAPEPSIELFDDFTSTAPAIAGAPGETPPPSQPPEDQTPPADLRAIAASLPLPSLQVAELKPPASQDLGDNVEFF
jgi:hypothetical protein